MGGYILDWVLLAVFIVGITALNGVITHGIALFFFGRKSGNEYVDMNNTTQKGWRKMVRE